MNSRWVGTNTYEWPNGSQSQLPGGGAPSSRGGDGVSGGGLEPVFPGVRTADWTTYSAPPRTSSSLCDGN